MAASSEPRSLELSPTATVGLVLVFATSGGLGYLWGGIGGGFFAALGITTTVAIGGFVLKIRSEDRTRNVGPAPNLSGLAPGQALSVMGAMTGGEGALSFKSELLTKLEKIDETLEDNPAAALEALEPFASEHPRSPAVHLRRARALRAHGDTDTAANAVTTAVGFALDGGMNPMAATIFVEFEAMKEQLDLEARHLRTLGKALAQRGHTAQAQWCESRQG
ncbi:MAG: hypothetical protein ACRBN8_32265 [Nannocystales bacterium]